MGMLSPKNFTHGEGSVSRSDSVPTNTCGAHLYKFFNPPLCLLSFPPATLSLFFPPTSRPPPTPSPPPPPRTSPSSPTAQPGEERRPRPPQRLLSAPLSSTRGGRGSGVRRHRLTSVASIRCSRRKPAADRGPEDWIYDLRPSRTHLSPQRCGAARRRSSPRGARDGGLRSSPAELLRLSHQ
jgi:hypothetical protein